MTRKAFLLVVLGTVLSGWAEAGGAEVPRVRLVWADFDGDELEDVYVVRPESGDSLFKNVGDGSFTDVTAQALPCVSCASVEVAWRDVDLDRRPDLLRLTVAGTVELLRNRGDGVFEDVTLAAGLEHVSGASTARWLDYDADGRADLEITTQSSALVYHNLGAFLFEAVTFPAVGRTADPHGAEPVRTLPGALDDELDAPDDGNEPDDGPTSGSRRAAGGEEVLAGSLVDGVHLAPLIVVAPPVDPLEPPGDAVDLQIPPFANRCAYSVRDTSTGDCVAVSSMPTLGKLYPISANLFVSTGGDVGIGTTSPAAKLEVAGTARVTDTLTLNPSGDQAVDVSTGSIYKGGVLFAHTRGGSANTALGQQALAGVTTGTSNTASGYRALFTNTTGINNTASGVRALHQNTSGDRNTASGYRSLYSNTAGFDNTATGAAALRSNTAGNRNTANGEAALRSNTIGVHNTAVGARALYSNDIGSRNTASGYAALFSNTSGVRNTATGTRALFSNANGTNNTACGYQALYSNTFAVANTAVGSGALFANTGEDNTALGASSLAANTTGHRNTACGNLALFTNTVGAFNTAIGSEALRDNTTGVSSTAIGFRALWDNTTGHNNLAIGYRALSSNTNGNMNIAIGRHAGSQVSESYNIAIGNEGVEDEERTIWVGTSGTHTRTFVAGIRGVTTDVADAIPVVVDSSGQLGTVSSSRRFKKDIADMGERTERLLELRPVVFRYEPEQEVRNGDVSLEYGLIAEEVAEIFPDLVVYDEEGLPFTVKYHLLSSMLLNEMRKQSREIDELAEMRVELERLRDIESRLAAIESRSSLAAGPRTDDR